MSQPTYLVWDREALEECYDQVDGIPLHNCYGNTRALTGMIATGTLVQRGASPHLEALTTPAGGCERGERIE